MRTFDLLVAAGWIDNIVNEGQPKGMIRFIESSGRPGELSGQGKLIVFSRLWRELRRTGATLEDLDAIANMGCAFDPEEKSKE